MRPTFADNLHLLTEYDVVKANRILDRILAYINSPFLEGDNFQTGAALGATQVASAEVMGVHLREKSVVAALIAAAGTNPLQETQYDDRSVKHRTIDWSDGKAVRAGVPGIGLITGRAVVSAGSSVVVNFGHTADYPFRMYPEAPLFLDLQRIGTGSSDWPTNPVQGLYYSGLSASQFTVHCDVLDGVPGDEIAFWWFLWHGAIG